MENSRLIDYYAASTAERERLSRREGQLELVRTQELLGHFLPASPMRVIDIGGGTGVYSGWLADAGHTVHLVDIVPEHVRDAEAIGTFTASVGDARSLSEPDEAFDVALVLGPLYHLRDPEHRLQALREARRVIRRGGWVIAAFITRTAPVLDAYAKGWIDAPRAVDLVTEQFDLGAAAMAERGFGAVSYFHWPSEARAELEAAGLEVLALLGVEGPGWIATDFEERWQTTEGREVILDTARLCEDHPASLALSAHLLASCRRP